MKDDCANPLISLPCCDSITSATVRWGCMRQELFGGVELLCALWFGLLFYTDPIHYGLFERELVFIKEVSEYVEYSVFCFS